MHLVPRELDKLIISQAGFLAQRRLARGVRLNRVEAIALITNIIQELIRDGTHTVAALMNVGKQILGRRHVLPSVAQSLHEIQVEGTFPDGTYLVTIPHPISSDDGDITKALYGSFLPIPDESLFPPITATEEYEPENRPGAVIVVKGRLDLNKGRRRRLLKVINKGDRPVQIGSHYHMIEVNPLLEFDRIQAYGFRLDIPAGTSVRFEPGDSKTVTLVEISGNMIIQGGNKIASGVVDPGRVEEILNNISKMGFAHVSCPTIEQETSPATMDRSAYATMFGPTTGDLVRLGDTELWIKVEKDYTVYGDECKFGGGKTIREGMGQASGRGDHQTIDLVITNALIIDYTGIYKADIGIKNGAIVGIGKSGNPDVMDGVDSSLVIGSKHRRDCR